MLCSIDTAASVSGPGSASRRRDASRHVLGRRWLQWRRRACLLLLPIRRGEGKELEFAADD